MDVESIIEKSYMTIKKNEGDYIGEDGLLYCGKCHTAKQVKINLLGTERTPMCLCKCESEKRETEKAEAEKKERLEQTKHYRLMGFPESNMQQWTFENADDKNPKLINVMKNYVDKFDIFREQGKGLLLFGGVGCGKTYAAACVANALIDQGIPVLMTNFARIANTVQGLFNGKQEYYDSLNRFPLLILDDLAAERKTEYMSEIVYNIIDARYRAKLPLIITTNLTSDEIKNPNDIAYARTFSRLLEMCFPFKAEGTDRRREKCKKDFKSMSDLLDL